jgi:N-acetylglucosamine-6-sulfatase
VFPTGSYYNYPVAEDGERIGPYGSNPGSYSARVMTKTARAFIDAPGQPFFLFYSAAAPHISIYSTDGATTPTPAPRDVDRYADLPAWRPVTFGARDDVSDMPRYIQQHAWNRRISDHVDLARQRELESLTSLDRQIGRLVETLPNNTLVIFMSDNGNVWGEHRWTTKKVPYEESIRIPMIVRWLGHVPSGVDRRLALNVDVVPTILAAAGLDPGTPTGRVGSTGQPVPPEGLDLLGAVRRDAFVLEHATDTDVAWSVPPYCGVRTDDGWMYTRYSRAGSADDGFEELYDVEADPLQQHNLAGDVSFEGDRLRLRALARTICDPTPPGYDWGR